MQLDHIGIAVRDLEQALAAYEAIGLKAGHRERVESEEIEACMIVLGESRLELIAATSPTSVVHRFLERRGEGIHHIAIAVDDIEAALLELRQRGLRVLDEVPRSGAGGSRVAFIHPSTMHGVLVELVQREVSA